MRFAHSHRIPTDRAPAQAAFARQRCRPTCLIFVSLLLTLPFVQQTSADTLSSTPNVLLILADDLGYGDLHDPRVRTPTLDELARTGLVLENFYAQPSCGPSRAALMTGTSPARNGMDFDPLPDSADGLHEQELTLGEVFHTAGYRTGYFGKWHLGDRPEYLPRQHGFDSYFGIPYSNDMWPFHHQMPVAPGSVPDPRLLAAQARVRITGGAHLDRTLPSPDFFPDLPLIEDDSVIERNADQAFYLERFSEAADRFISADTQKPFFVMLAYATPHVPLFAHPDFAGRSRRGLYGDVVEEMDSRIGQLLERLRSDGRLENTLVVFLSDNGPWLEYGIDGGSAQPFRGGKGTPFEGGWRVPAILNWPNHLKAGSYVKIASMQDLMPTLAGLVGVNLPADADIDGQNLLAANIPGENDSFLYFADFRGRGATSPLGRQLLAIRSGKWKLHVRAHRSRWLGWLVGYSVNALHLYDLEKDPGETTDVLGYRTDIADRLASEAEARLNTLCTRKRAWVKNTCDE